VPRIDQSLLERISKKLAVGKPRVYQLIDDKVRETHLPRHLAAVALASERGINISKYASADDLAVIRSIAKAYSPSPVHISTPVPSSSGRKTSQKKKSRSASPQPKERGNTVFVVHGRNEKVRKALFSLLRAFKLQPMEWNEALKKTGQGSPYVGTILESAFSKASAIVVLLTPDDEARLKKTFLTKKDPVQERKLTGQARPNVLFEAGMAFGRNPNSTILIQIGDVRPFSDVAGRHLVHLSNVASSRNELATKLMNAGCRVDTSGNDWMDAGDFEL
jgi:predicted nucleotide-binding protein